MKITLHIIESERGMTFKEFTNQIKDERLRECLMYSPASQDEQYTCVTFTIESPDDQEYIQKYFPDLLI